MIINGEEYILYKETQNDALSVLTKGVLEENGVRFQYIQNESGIRYKTRYLRYHQFYVHKDDLEIAEKCLNNDVFADLPWDPDSDNPDPEPDYPWYYDNKKREQIGKIVSRIALGIFVLLIVWMIVVSN